MELYTSEGCSRCPPAERWLTSLAAKAPVPEKVVPIALHVDYWDYVGWNDPYAGREFSLRQRKLTLLQRLALVYTPQVMLQGRDFRGWATPAFDAAVDRINAGPARARLKLEIASATDSALVVRAGAQLLAADQVRDAALYVAAYGTRLERRVVLRWEGPVPFDGARLDLERALPLVPGARAADSGIAAFTQNRRTLEVLQALSLATCP